MLSLFEIFPGGEVVGPGCDGRAVPGVSLRRSRVIFCICEA